MPVMSFFQKLSIRISPKLDSNSGPRSNGISPFPNDNSKARVHKADGSNNTSKDTHINPPKSSPSPPRTLNSTSMLIDTSTSPNFSNNNNNNNNNSINNSNGNNQTNSTDIVNNNTKKTNATTASSRSNSKKNKKTNIHSIPQMQVPQHPLEKISSGSNPTAQAILKDIKLSLMDFSLCRTLGTGSFGRVHLVQSKNNQKFYAMKVLKKSEVVRLKQVEHTNNEKRILKEISHPFVVKLWGTFQDPTNLYMVMDYVVGGELFSVLRKAQRFENHVAKFYAAEVLLAFEYLHSKDIIYRDLKPENLLLDRNGHIKITDFGFAKRVLDVTWTLCGTPDYLAPEVIQSKGYSKAVDWYSLGILIFEMLAGYPPFYDEDHVRLYEKILSGRVKYPGFFDPNVKDLLKRLLTADLSKRYGNLKGGSEDIKQHPWFKAVDWDRLLKLEIDAPHIPTVAGEGDASNFDLYPEEKEPYGKPGPDTHRDKFKSF